MKIRSLGGPRNKLVPTVVAPVPSDVALIDAYELSREPTLIRTTPQIRATA